MESTSTIMYPMITENALMMSIEAFERSSLSQGCLDRPIVRAAGLLGRDSSTEVIDVNKLSQKSTSVIQYVEVADTEGRLYCVDGLVSTPCWLKIVTLANDCQSCNVLLMTTDKGVILKTIRNITPGEPLLMWFTENILAMLNMPFLTPSNIQGQNRYICHICNNLFEYPNPLKIHLALKCNRLDTNHLWSGLAKEFSSSPRPSLSLSLFPQSTFKFKLTRSSQDSPTSISPILVDTMDNNVPLTNNNSPESSDQPSPSSSNPLSPNSSSTQISPNSSTQVSPVRKDIPYRQSAFKPYANQSNIFANVCPLTRDETVLPPYNVQTTTAPISTDVHAAQMETIVSNLGKSKQGHLCIYCGKVYSRKYGLKIHIRTHTGYKPLKCKYCLRPFGDPSNLNKHVRLHADGETPYRCELCGKVLVRRRDLERHLRSRHQENVDQASDTSSDGIDV
ncbi:PR domain zinc finger protein 13 [Eufriesea mexicana]|uniref:protein snail n=1 Tax=Eufriesea mexicana TaxID=516756 RepID=UPI00083BEC65|nr:PREDICTED: protein snail [Eufriesea mexicana]OAD60489.1 PR domain zinc finger protein 13 [Eufriesea mexicana]